ncbi:MAG: hypothetical protein CVU57_04335 [Deltaproteobacteria bacterium HGW-Deltaproteobacteria-15]|jgi:hypothetical protein|nr:MAG: hypothetical protein CVU57_04335 [Deltaproteobacteria bacterium HGW-Deltaproteobacteria-15]
MEEDTKEKTGYGAGSMIAPHPNRLRPVEELAREENLKVWETAGLMRAAGWAAGKQVDRSEFNSMLASFRKRPMGGGRLR